MNPAPFAAPHCKELPMLKFIGAAALALVLAAVALALFAAFSKPDTFQVERRLLIKAPPDKLWPLVSDLKGFHQWNPFGAKDPGAKLTFSANSSGLGARYAWESAVIGVGSMEVTEVKDQQFTRYQLDFLKPFEAHNQAEFALVPAAGGTEVRWTMKGPAPLMSKVMDVVFNMDRMVGTDFEAGLAKLKTLAEQP
jgi:uncharacterized protein YndB with AHSA1/START domain